MCLLCNVWTACVILPSMIYHNTARLSLNPPSSVALPRRSKSDSGKTYQQKSTLSRRMRLLGHESTGAAAMLHFTGSLTNHLSKGRIGRRIKPWKLVTVFFKHTPGSLFQFLFGPFPSQLEWRAGQYPDHESECFSA